MAVRKQKKDLRKRYSRMLVRSWRIKSDGDENNKQKKFCLEFIKSDRNYQR
jgi:hypothetical protein